MSRHGEVTALVAVLVLALMPLLGFAAAPVQAEDASVGVSNFAFTPAEVTIEAGEAVTWDWDSGTHSVVEEGTDDEWCSVRSSGSCSRTFPEAGTYDYYCSVHPGSMRASVVVLGVPPTVTIDAPVDGASVDGVITASGSAVHPDGVTDVAYSIDAGPFVEVETRAGSTWSTTLDTTIMANGVHTMAVRATGGDGGVATATVSFQVSNPADLDLTVAALQATTDQVGSSRISGTVSNDGPVSLTGVRLVLEYQYEDAWHPLDERALDVDAFGTTSFVRVWEDVAKLGAFPVRAVIDADDAFGETDETNNLRQTTAGFGTDAVPGTDLLDPL